MVFGASENKEVTDEEFTKDLIKDVGIHANRKSNEEVTSDQSRSRNSP